MTTFESEIEFDGGETILVEVTYGVYGRYWAGTYYEPPEYPELEIEGVEVVEDYDLGGFEPGVELYDLLSPETLRELEDRAWEAANADAEDAAIYAAECAAEWRADPW